jgi:hypothetical protein
MNAVQMLPIHITPIGILLAMAFAASVSLTLYWMLKIQHSVTRGITSAERMLIIQKGPVVVGITPGLVMATAIFLAATLAKERHVPLLLLSVLEVPYTLPPGATMPVQQKAGEESLAEAKQLARSMGVENVETKLVSARAASKALISESEEFGASTNIWRATDTR